jgi:hypothetical protein
MFLVVLYLFYFRLVKISLHWVNFGSFKKQKYLGAS